VFDPRAPASPCYHCLFPEDGGFRDAACSTMGVFAPLVGVIGAMQAAEAMKLIIQTGAPLTGRLLLLDGRAMEWTSIALARNPACTVCSACSTRADISPKET
jgi:molybdopterin/thiamine biosynthesis adenylyltransferase